MSAVAVVRYLLVNDATLLSAVPAVRIKTSVLPLGTPLPAIMIEHISTTERLTVDMSTPARFATSRVQVTALAKTYTQCASIVELIRKALPHTRGLVAGVQLDSILPEGANPDFYDVESETHAQSRDFFVAFHQAA